MNVGLVDDMFEIESDEDDESLDISFLSLTRRRLVPTLKKLAVTCIASNIDYWVEHLPDKPSDYLYIISAFDCLNDMDTMSILKELSELQQFRNIQLHIIFHHNLREMDFTLINNYHVKDAALRTLKNRCQKLHTLKIGFASLTLKTQMMIPAWYPNIQHLHLEFEIDVLASNNILQNCKNLRTIYLLQRTNEYPTIETKNHNIRSFSLVASQPCMLPSRENKGKFVRLVEKLERIYSLSLEGFSDMPFHQLSPLQSHVKFFNLAALKVSTISFKDVVVVTELMQNLVSLDIRNCFFNSEIFLSIGDIKNLKSLTLSFSVNFDFDSNVETCLLKVGKQLESLCLLRGICNINTSVIGFCCPNLKTLRLENCKYIYFRWLQPGEMKESNSAIDCQQGCISLCQACPALEKLVLHEFEINVDDNIDEYFCPLLKGSNHLRELSIRIPLITSVSSKFLDKIFEKFDFGNVEMLDISYNIAVTKRTILRILENLPNLKVLSTRNNLTKEEIISLNTLIVNYGLDIVLNT